MVKKAKKEEVKQTEEPVNIKTTQEKLVPKFCTNINIGLLKNKNVVLTMAYSEGQNSSALIERIVIDLEHTKSLNEALSRVLEEAENV